MSTESSGPCQSNERDTDLNLRLKEIEESLVEMEKEAERLYLGSPKSPGYRGDSENNLIMRHLLILFRGKEMRKYRKKVGQHLSFILIQKNGLQSFIRATCDLDRSSEKMTTFHQRFRALSTIITDMPALCCSLEEYYVSLSRQILCLLTLPEANEYVSQQWKASAHIFSALYSKNRGLAKKTLLGPICNSLGCQESWLTINESLIAIHRLILSDFDKNLFIPRFPNLFHICLSLDESISPTKSIANEIILDMLKFIEQSLYLIDDALFNHLETYNLYSLGLTKYGDKEILSVVPNENHGDADRISLKSLDKIVQATLGILNEMNDDYRMDFFLLLLEKFAQPSTNQLLLCSLIDSLQEQTFNLILNHPSKAIQFIVSNLRRMIMDDKKDSIQAMMTEEDTQQEEKEEIRKGTNILQMDSLSMVIQILALLLEEKKRLNTKEIQSLRECKVYLSRIGMIDGIAEEEKLKIQSLEKELDSLDETQARMDSNTKNEFEEAVRNLNSSFLPMRAHALVTLRKLIDSKHKATIENRRQLLSLIKASLSDPESYVYIAAVNALSSLALAHTEEALPLLIEAYHDKLRSTKERVSVGESLVWVVKYLGQMAHHFSKPVVNCFLTGLTDEEESIRISSLSNLGQFTSVLGHSLSYYIVEIVYAVECILKTDSRINVKRACIMFIHLMLNGLNKDSVEAILDHLKSIYHLIKAIDSKSLGDDVIRVHAHLALEAIDWTVKELLAPPTDFIKPIRIQ